MLRMTLLAFAVIVSGCAPSAGDARPIAGEPGTTTLLGAPDRFFTANGVTIRYREIGAGEPVVLLHGYTDRVEMWTGTADSLARDFRVIVPDLRGFGASTKSGDPAMYGQRLVDDVAALLDGLRIERAHVVGYSMGGAITAHVAIRHPSRVITATYVAAAIIPDSGASRRVFGPYVDALRRGDGLRPFFEYILPTWSDSMLASIVPTLEATNDSASLVASLDALPTLAVDSISLARGPVPAFVIVAEPDPMVQFARPLARTWPGATYIELPKGDHVDIVYAPELISGFRKMALRSMVRGRDSD